MRAAWIAVTIAILAAPLAGCVGDGSPADAGAGTAGDGAAAGDANRTVWRNHTLHVDYYARLSGPSPVWLDTQNMEETNWEVQVPDNATRVRARAAWEPSTPLARHQAVMIHVGTREDPGEMLAGTGGASPQTTDWTTVPDGEATLVMMVHVYTSGPTQPVGVEVDQETEIGVAFR